MKRVVKGILKIHKAVARSPIGQALGTIAAGLACGPAAPACAAAASAVASATFTAINGGSVGDIIKAAAITYVTARAFGGLHDLSYSPGKAIAHGVVGGASNKLRGGSFRDGFLGAAVGQTFSPLIGSAFPGKTALPTRVFAAAVVGGTASALGGGKFANGAISGAFGRLFNHEKVVRYKGADGKWYTTRVWQSADGYSAEQAGATSISTYHSGTTTIDRLVPTRTQLGTAFADSSKVAGFASVGFMLAGQPELALPAALIALGTDAAAIMLSPPPASQFTAKSVDKLIADIVPNEALSTGVKIVGPAQQTVRFLEQTKNE